MLVAPDLRWLGMTMSAPLLTCSHSSQGSCTPHVVSQTQKSQKGCTGLSS